MSDTGKSAAERMAGISVKPTAAELREAREREAAAERALLAVGTVWRENDPRAERFVKVVQIERHHVDVIVIRTVNIHGACIGPVTKARRDRFGGTKRGNYSFVRSAS